MERFNFHRATLERPPHAPEGFETRHAVVGSAIGARHLGGTVFELPAGARGWPYHWEAAQEEWLVVLSGTPTLRTPAGEDVLAPGDAVCFPVGPDGAHGLRNASDEPCRVLILSNQADVNVVVFPDADKVGVGTRWTEHYFPASADVGYWEGQ